MCRVSHQDLVLLGVIEAVTGNSVKAFAVQGRILAAGFAERVACPPRCPWRTAAAQAVLSPGLWPGPKVSAAEDGEGGKSPPSFQSVLAAVSLTNSEYIFSETHMVPSPSPQHALHISW